MIVSKFTERYSVLSNDEMQVENVAKEHSIITDRRVPNLGVMLIGLGGNNGSTFVAGSIANKK